MELVDQDVDVSGIMSETSRQRLYNQHVTEQLSNGVGTINANTLLYEMPGKLTIDAEAARKAALQAAVDKARPTLVQAAAFQRTKEPHKAAQYMNNLLACARVNENATTGLQWSNKSELLDLYGLFCCQHQDHEVRGEMARALSLTQDEQQSILDAVESGQFRGGVDAGVADDSRAKAADKSFF